MFKYYLTDTHDGAELKAQKLLPSAPGGMRADCYGFRSCIKKKNRQLEFWPRHWLHWSPTQRWWWKLTSSPWHESNPFRSGRCQLFYSSHLRNKDTNQSSLLKKTEENRVPEIRVFHAPSYSGNFSAIWVRKVVSHTFQG